VESPSKLDMLRSIGADHVINYTLEDFTKNGQLYDFILDVVASRSIYDYKRALSPNGIFCDGRRFRGCKSSSLFTWAFDFNDRG